ncbi:DUF1471 domain-containing protein [Enterobacteriaceae bacterium ML5]|nr:DUF1471 domain-containing protein [Enterobacteriaceae bacterium ML5]
MLSMIPKIFLVIALVSGTAIASETVTVKEVNAQQATSLQKIGNVTVSDIRGSTDDAVRALSHKVEAMGGYYYKMISLGTSSDSSLWRGTAIVYK